MSICDKKMMIEAIKEEDLAGCAALFVRVFSAPPWNESWSAEAVNRRFDDFWRTPGFFGLLAQNEERIVGFALGCVEQWSTSRHFHLREMGVAPELQRGGMGTQLMRALEDRLREHDVQKIILHTSRASDAQTFYDRCGFDTNARTVMMSKWLTPQDK